jgi:hypothetical protein
MRATMRVLNKFVMSATIIAMSTMQVLAQAGGSVSPSIGRPHSGGHGVPEIDATAGIATLAVLLTVAIIVYARSKSTTQTTV